MRKNAKQHIRGMVTIARQSDYRASNSPQLSNQTQNPQGIFNFAQVSSRGVNESTSKQGLALWIHMCSNLMLTKRKVPFSFVCMMNCVWLLPSLFGGFSQPLVSNHGVIRLVRSKREAFRSVLRIPLVPVNDLRARKKTWNPYMPAPRPEEREIQS